MIVICDIITILLVENHKIYLINYYVNENNVDQIKERQQAVPSAGFPADIRHPDLGFRALVVSPPTKCFG